MNSLNGSFEYPNQSLKLEYKKILYPDFFYLDLCEKPRGASHLVALNFLWTRGENMFSVVVD